MLYLNIKPIFKARGIDKPYTFLIKAGMSSHSAHNILNSTPRIFRLDHIELLCRILVCDPNDLLGWQPDKDQQYAINHPLFTLIQTEASTNIKETLSTIPFKQLKEATKAFHNPEKESPQ